MPLSVTKATEQPSKPEVDRVNQLVSASHFSLKVQVGEIMVDAVFYTAAEVSIISLKICCFLFET
ncbi:hypothetical protein DPMN_124943 [Dreissena polymorpha]|uniref:Uncharacterized protein n=1 Tax=Dreissena polymorpha TaxID=45954 RepID=A0A9D4JU89_DREPO|nr:hypothetical protein DPMN_124943 [Dreissena polymorpha]